MMNKPDDTTRLWPDTSDRPSNNQTTQVWPDSEHPTGNDDTTELWPAAGGHHPPVPPARPAPPSPSPTPDPTSRRSSYSPRKDHRNSTTSDEQAPAVMMFVLMTCVISIFITGLLWGWPSLDPHSPAFFPHWWSYHAVKFAVIESVVIVTFIIIAVRRR